MILQALAHYYDILSQDPQSDIAPPGYSTVGVSFALNISPQGEILDILPLFEQVQAGSKTVERPQRKTVPEQVKRSSGIHANFLCDNSAYLLGLSEKGGADFGFKRFQAFRDLHEHLLAGVDSEAARAVLAFLDHYEPAAGRELPAVAGHLDDLLKGGNLVFMVGEQFAHEDSAIRLAWETYKAGGEVELGQCLVTGETAPIARLHPSLKGVRDTQATGASLVGFNARAYESYHFEQGRNSPVSEKAAFAYTTALNYLLSSANPNKKLLIGDSTVVYWAESEKRAFANAFECIFEPPLVEDAGASAPAGSGKADIGLKDVAEKVRRVQKLDLDGLLADIKDENPRFYVLALAPNVARVSVRFFLTDPFQKIVGRLMQHYRDLEIVKEFDNQPDYITVRHILDETTSKKAKDQQASPLMAGALFRSIISGAPYPAALFYALINRIRADVDDKQKKISKVNYLRAAIIKAFLIRKYRSQPDHPIQEVLKMSLNEQSTHPAYVLGRLFAVLEKVQQEAIGDTNASIRDRYFTSACASPASVFPVLLRLSQHHISKAEYGYAMDHRIQDILSLLDVEKNPIPARLTLDEQGVFILGYYHQRADFYLPRKDKPAGEPSAAETLSTELNQSTRG